MPPQQQQWQGQQQQWQPGQQNPGQPPAWQQNLQQMFRQPPAQQGGWGGGAPRNVTGTRTSIGLCAIFLGALGIHKFMLGMKTPGLILLGSTVLTAGVGLVVTSIVGIIEGVIYLSKSDAEFYATYVVGGKEWF